MKNKALFASGSTEWETPWDLFKQFDGIYHFTVDVCATPDNTKCPRYFTPEVNGLAQDWTGTCWMNPPYGRGVDPWIKKAYESAQAGAVVVALLPARTDTKWFHRYIYHNAEIIFLQGRVRFTKGNITGPATFPSMIVVWDRRRKNKHITGE
jgi:site-specific DNA-methyltransferase (adenine-specific)